MKKNLVLLHGALGSQKQFKTIVNELSKQYQIFRINFSGHGGKSIRSDFSIPLFTEELLDFLHQRNLKNIHIFGYSMGGYVALKLAAKQLINIERIYTLGTKFDWSPEATEQELKKLQPDLIKKKVPQFAESLQKEHDGEDWKAVVRQTAKMMQQLSKEDQLSHSEFQRIKTPVTIGLGDSDKMVSKKESLWAKDQLSEASFIELKNCPHPLKKVPIEELQKLLS